MNRKKLLYILILVLMLTNVACAKKEKDKEQARKKAYREILSTMLDTGSLKVDGKEYIHEQSQKYVVSSSDENKFTVTDIDDDGSEELIIEIYGLSTVENKAYVFDYREEKGACCEAEFFCRDTRFYEGCAQVNSPKNQGPTGYFWPYALYKYYPQYDAYEFVGYATALDERYYESFSGKPFPKEYDLDNDGVVNMIQFGEKNSEWVMMDNAEYEKWRASFVDEDTKKEPEFLSITSENVKEALGE